MKSALLTVQAVAKRLGFGLTATYALLASGKLPSVRIGFGPRARYRVDEDVLERWIAAQRTSPSRSDRRSMTREEERKALGLDVEHEFS